MLQTFIGMKYCRIMSMFSHIMSRYKDRYRFYVHPYSFLFYTSLFYIEYHRKYRLDRLAIKKSGELVLEVGNYPEAKTFREIFDAYYLDLTLQGLMEGL